MLASLLIDEVRKIPASNLVYFYCRNNDEKRNNFIAMARSFLQQLCYMDTSITSYLYETAVSDGGSCLATRKSAEEILSVCLRRIGPAYIILDGIDECRESEQKAIIPWLRKFVDESIKEPKSSRCIFLSQYDASTKALLSSIPSIQITADDNRADIDAYCRNWSDKIKTKLRINDSEAINIARQTSERAKGEFIHIIRKGVCSLTALEHSGMFLFAKLVMSNLYGQTSIFNLRREMQPEVFPKGLDEA